MLDYPKILPLHDPEAAKLLTVECVVQEKIDGSQISFGVDEEGDLHIKSHHAPISEHNPHGMFGKAVEEIQKRRGSLVPGYTYRGEYLQKPKHNTLAYDRVPEGNIILFDVEENRIVLGLYAAADQAVRLGLEFVPTYGMGVFQLDELDRLIATQPSVLGGMIEGVVLKPFEHQFNRYGQRLLGKRVADRFKELHQKNWKEKNPWRTDILQQLTERYSTEARYEKAYQHLRDAGVLVGELRDIGPLIGEVARDTHEEEGQAIKDFLFKWIWKDLGRQITKGVPDWYKRRLMDDSTGID